MGGHHQLEARPPQDQAATEEAESEAREGGIIELDISRSEYMEKELDAMIRRQDAQRRKSEGERLEEELCAISVRRYQERARRQIRAEWFGFYCRMADNHARLSQEYERRAEELCEEG